MKRKNINLLTLIALRAMSFAMLAAPTWGQNGSHTPKTNTRILYHGGPIMSGTSANGARARHEARPVRLLDPTELG